MVAQTSFLETADADTTIVNLKEKIVYVYFEDDTGNWMAKMVSVPAVPGGKTIKSINKTAGMLLSLLAQEVGQGILLDDFFNLVKGKFYDPNPGNIVAEAKIREFLSKLELPPFGLLDINKSARNLKPDPADLFDPTKPEKWVQPDVKPGKPPYHGKTTIYNTGYTAVTIPRGWP
jgi:hypothetical protein